MKTITFIDANYTFTVKADDIVATRRGKGQYGVEFLYIYLRGVNDPIALNNTSHYDEWLAAIWEEN